MSRRAIAFLGMPQIARMLALPEGLRAIPCRDDFLRDGVAVLIEGDALDDQPDGVELPRLPVEMADPSALARQAPMRGVWLQDSATLEVGCPVPPCQWSKDWEYEVVTPALVADTVQQHLTEKHAAEGQL